MANSYPTAAPDVVLLHTGISDVGCRREKNEDSMGLKVSEAPERSVLMVIADGVGGSAAGEVASKMAVETVENEVFRDGEPANPSAALGEALRVANRAIYSAAAENPLHAGMATTCTAALVRNSRLYIGHVGDCRAYLVGGGRVARVTQDHSMGAEYDRQGQSLPPDKQNLANVLTRWLGSENEVQVDSYDGIELSLGDTLVICSDGLTKMVNDDEILHLTSMHLPDGACRRLVDMARERGGPDNITVHVARLSRG